MEDALDPFRVRRMSEGDATRVLSVRVTELESQLSAAEARAAHERQRAVNAELDNAQLRTEKREALRAADRDHAFSEEKREELRRLRFAQRKLDAAIPLLRKLALSNELAAFVERLASDADICRATLHGDPCIQERGHDETDCEHCHPMEELPDSVRLHRTPGGTLFSDEEAGR